MRRVVVTGLGMVSPLGCGVEITWKRILESQSGAGLIKKFDTTDFPNPIEMIDELHQKYNCKLLVSVWPSFVPNIPNWELFNKDSLLLNIESDNYSNSDRINIGTNMSAQIITNIKKFVNDIYITDSNIKPNIYMFFIIGDIYNHVYKGNMEKHIIQKILNSHYFLTGRLPTSDFRLPTSDFALCPLCHSVDKPFSNFSAISSCCRRSSVVVRLQISSKLSFRVQIARK